jgi:tetratricopeptide (TPR) repeat protein
MGEVMHNESSFGNYTTDRAAFAYLYYTRDYEKALVKGQNVLGDIWQMQFSNNEEKLTVISKSYSDLAATYNELHKYEEMIRFESVALRVAGPNDLEYLICFGYHQLKQDGDAVHSCTQAIEDRPNIVSAYYWRGLAYQALNQPESALADLKVVAESEDKLRGSAALAMSAIYLNTGKIKTALDILNEYPYLFGDDYVNRETAAAAYYARCTILAQLGDIEKALADCSLSLHYENRADVSAKQQELLKRVWTPKGREL